MEFVLETAVLVLLGTFFAVRGSWLWGAWLLGCGLSYGALAAHAVTLFPARNLDAELAGVDSAAALRRYGVAQLLLFVPLVIAILALAEALLRRADGVDAHGD